MSTPDFHRGLLIALLACIAMLAGCERKPRLPSAPPDFRRFGELPGLKQSAEPALQNEYARLVSEEATPARLAALEAPVDVEAQGMLQLEFPTRRVQGLLEDIEKIYPAGRFAFSSAASFRARDLCKNEEALIGKAIARYEAADARFPFDPCQGLLADLSFLDVIELAHRGRALQAQIALEQGDLATVQRHVFAMLELDHRLSQARNVVARMKAAQLRLEALRVMEALVQDEGATKALLTQLQKVLQAQVDDWPSDAQAWNGDRAQGLHTYEMIRHGLVLSVFTDKELKDLSEEAGISATAKAIAKDVDRDEQYYLNTMRQVIAACDQPYHERRKLLERIGEELHDKRFDPDFPLVAGRILLLDLDAGHRRQAADRATCEGWLIALCLATDVPPPAFTRNPETGAAYVIEREPTRILLHHARATAPDEAIIVPVLP
jgi:hypothetical protein